MEFSFIRSCHPFCVYICGCEFTKLSFNCFPLSSASVPTVGNCWCMVFVSMDLDIHNYVPSASSWSSFIDISNLRHTENLQCASPLQKGPVHFCEVPAFVRVFFFFLNIIRNCKWRQFFRKICPTTCSRVFHHGVLWCQLAQLPPIQLLLKESNGLAISLEVGFLTVWEFHWNILGTAMVKSTDCLLYSAHQHKNDGTSLCICYIQHKADLCWAAGTGSTPSPLSVEVHSQVATEKGLKRQPVIER